nr:hypothetical protein [Pseudomonas sp. Q1-7]
MRITLVKKVLADGQDCRKCRDVMERLERGGHLDRIDRILVADERNPASAGWLAGRTALWRGCRAVLRGAP